MFVLMRARSTGIEAAMIVVAPSAVPKINKFTFVPAKVSDL